MIGDVVGTFSVAGYSSVTYSLVNNPNDYFRISGNKLIQAIDIPNGVVTIRVKAIGAGLVINQSVNLMNLSNVSLPPSDPNPPFNPNQLYDANLAALTSVSGETLMAFS